MADGMRSLAEAVPWRHLVGLENRLKNPGQITMRIAEDMRVKGRTADEAFTTLRDAIRYTFQYPEERYNDGVADDFRRLTESGFTKVRLENAWEWLEHKGDDQLLAGAVRDAVRGAVPHAAELRGLAAHPPRL